MKKLIIFTMFALIVLAIPVQASDISPTRANLLVNGESRTPAAYNIDGSNFFRLRDVAYMLNDTAGQFNVSWDEINSVILLSPGQVYIPVGGELAPRTGDSSDVFEIIVNLSIDGNIINLPAFNINDSNYFMLRDLGNLLAFDIGWEEATSTITITTASLELTDEELAVREALLADYINIVRYSHYFNEELNTAVLLESFEQYRWSGEITIQGVDITFLGVTSGNELELLFRFFGDSLEFILSNIYLWGAEIEMNRLMEIIPDVQ